MANPIKGEVPLEVDGKRYTFVLGTYALAALERRMKMPWPNGASMKSSPPCTPGCCATSAI